MLGSGRERRAGAGDARAPLSLLEKAEPGTAAAECGAEPERAEERRALLAVDALREADSPRVNGEDADHVRILADLDEGALPPILVHGETMRVIDGMHRLRAARLRGRETVEVEYFDGGEDDVFALSVRLNIAHGLPLSRENRMAAARRLLVSRPSWSDRRIAVTAGLAASTVASLRHRSTGRDEQLTARVGRDGRVRPVRASEGRLRASQVIGADPEASLRSIAERAGIATATAKEVRDRLRRGLDPVPSGLRAAERDGSPAPAVPPPVTGPVLAGLRGDPSLRTDVGRTLLRLLSAHSLGDDAAWQRLARGVPGHRRELLAEAARCCAEHWLRFAGELEAPPP